MPSLFSTNSSMEKYLFSLPPELRNKFYFILVNKLQHKQTRPE